MMKKHKKKYRNIFRDRLADYYFTNREITKKYDEEYAKARAEGRKLPWKTREKTMLVVTLGAALLLVIKCLFFR